MSKERLSTHMLNRYVFVFVNVSLVLHCSVFVLELSFLSQVAATFSAEAQFAFKEPGGGEHAGVCEDSLMSNSTSKPGKRRRLREKLIFLFLLLNFVVRFLLSFIVFFNLGGRTESHS